MLTCIIILAEHGVDRCMYGGTQQALPCTPSVANLAAIGRACHSADPGVLCVIVSARYCVLVTPRRTPSSEGSLLSARLWDTVRAAT